MKPQQFDITNAEIVVKTCVIVQDDNTRKDLFEPLSHLKHVNEVSENLRATCFLTCNEIAETEAG